ncbi:MAG: hypothetical protein E6J58_17635 [Deltaproteobacteria bacterium]|nr:MAG: hypothetical protein E6J58_17635 [Deltaproteobacteria bacterium]
MKQAAVAALLALAACQGQGELKKKMRNDACTRNFDCAYGLECVDGSAPAEGGVAVQGRTCQFQSFGDCEGDGTQPGPDGQPQCLDSYRCRNGHCTVQCAGHKDCKEGEVCKVGICNRGGKAVASCTENRDCIYPESCYYGQCVTRPASLRCSSDLDCPAENRCINGVCQ